MTRSRYFSNSSQIASAAKNAPPLSLGTRGDGVRRLQVSLRCIGFEMPKSRKPDGTYDGIFGSETARGVVAAERKFGLGVDAGIAGERVIGALDAYLVAIEVQLASLVRNLDRAYPGPFTGIVLRGDLVELVVEAPAGSLPQAARVIEELLELSRSWRTITPREPHYMVGATAVPMMVVAAPVVAIPAAALATIIAALEALAIAMTAFLIGLAIIEIGRKYLPGSLQGLELFMATIAVEVATLATQVRALRPTITEHRPGCLPKFEELVTALGKIVKKTNSGARHITTKLAKEINGLMGDVIRLILELVICLGLSGPSVDGLKRIINRANEVIVRIGLKRLPPFKLPKL